MPVSFFQKNVALEGFDFNTAVPQCTLLCHIGTVGSKKLTERPLFNLGEDFLFQQMIQELFGVEPDRLQLHNRPRKRGMNILKPSTVTEWPKAMIMTRLIYNL